MALSILLPFYWIFTLSIKNYSDARSETSTLWFEPTFQYYKALIQDSSFLRYFWNSFLICVGSVILAVLVGVPAAYAFSRTKFRGQKWLFNLLFITRLSPGAVFVIPYFYAYKQFNLLDTHLGLLHIYFALNLTRMWHPHPNT